MVSSTQHTLLNSPHKKKKKEMHITGLTPFWMTVLDDEIPDSLMVAWPGGDGHPTKHAGEHLGLGSWPGTDERNAGTRTIVASRVIEYALCRVTEATLC